MTKKALKGSLSDHRNQVAFDDVYHKYKLVVKGYARKAFSGVNSEEFESLVWDRINRLVDDGRFMHVSSELGYIFGVLHHVAWEQSKKLRTQCDMISLEELSAELECPPVRAQSPADVAARRELLAKITAFVPGLAHPLPVIFEHYFLEGHNSAWIARKLHMNPSTVRFHIHELRREIEARFGDSF